MRMFMETFIILMPEKKQVNMIIIFLSRCFSNGQYAFFQPFMSLIGYKRLTSWHWYVKLDDFTYVSYVRTI